ncbi:MAG: methanogenesis marker 14 protein [Candidatus Thorarchaeota archaeon]
MVRPGRVLKPRSIGVSSLRTGPFYTVVSVELGNTTTKCILVTTNLRTAEIYEIDKEVRFTRDVRPPSEGEEVFGSTIFGVELTEKSVSEMVTEVLTTVLSRSRLDVERDLHFAVRSTGVTAGFASPSEVGAIVKALADGCLRAGIPPRKMTASLSPENLPPGLRDFTWLKKVYFDGAVTSTLPPSDAGIVANEMEGELVTAGIKGAVKGTTIDFRNPVMTLDFGTTLAGRVTDMGRPYARTIGSFVGLAGAIPDAIVRGSGLIDSSQGNVLDLPRMSRKRSTLSEDWLEEARKLVRVSYVGAGDTRFGTVPVNPKAAQEGDVVLIGVDAGVNGSSLGSLQQLGERLVKSEGLDALIPLVDGIQVDIVQQIVTLAEQSGIVLPETSLGLTGRAITTGRKPALIADTLQLQSGTKWTDDHILVVVEDGLAMGAAVAARCMNSMGTPSNPMGGRRGDGCIMGARMKIQKKR